MEDLSHPVVVVPLSLDDPRLAHSSIHRPLTIIMVQPGRAESSLPPQALGPALIGSPSLERCHDTDLKVHPQGSLETTTSSALDV